MKIILASQSENRKKLLQKADLVFHSFSPNIPEENFINPKKPEESCLDIAKQKALKAQKHYPKDIIIACDQMVLFKGELFGKAHTFQKAIENLTKFQGQTHDLLTGLCMLFEEKIYLTLSKNRMTMHSLTQKQITKYVLKEKPLKCAGSYKIESKGICLFEKIESDDWSSIEGLPLIKVIKQLTLWSYPFLDNAS